MRLDSATPNPSPRTRRFDPLTAFKTPTELHTSGRKMETKSFNSSQGSVKGKGKSKDLLNVGMCDHPSEEQNDRLWVDIYEPKTEAELAVHSRKVEDLRRWLNEAFEGGPSSKLTRYRRILVLTGPAGTAKTTTIRVLAREMGFEILEWRNAMDESSSTTLDHALNFPSTGSDTLYPSFEQDLDRETLYSKFEAFINRASSCQNVFTATGGSESRRHHIPPSPPTQSGPSSQSAKWVPKRKIILLEDLPNILHPETQAKFHAALQSLVVSPPPQPPVPVVIIVSDAGMRGEASDERLTNGTGWGKDRNGVVDVRTVLSRDLLGGPYVTQISFNPIAPTLLLKALQALIRMHYTGSIQRPPSKEVLDIIVESSNGDIRSAVMALQFASVIEMGNKGRKRKNGSVVVLESVTRREQSLVLFHLMGKVLYNKRKGDPPSASASAKDIQREKAMDALLKDPPKLPTYLQEHERRTSRIDVDRLYADSPIDSSLFSLYIQQNYPQFCDDIEQCDEVADWLSWVDSSGGEAWYQANPHSFHLLTLGTLHSLPSPVTRRSQKIFKPAFFDCLQREKDAWEGVRDTQAWIAAGQTNGAGFASSTAGWSPTEVAMELGGVLRAKDTLGSTTLPPPGSHQLFSKLSFMFGKSFGNMDMLNESDLGGRANRSYEEEEDQVSWTCKHQEYDEEGWLESDDIEEF